MKFRSGLQLKFLINPLFDEIPYFVSIQGPFAELLNQQWSKFGLELRREVVAFGPIAQLPFARPLIS